MKRILILASILILSACFKEEVCDEYDDFYNIKIGCSISDFKNDKNFVLKFDSKEGYKLYEISNVANLFFDNNLATFDKPRENQIHYVTLTKTFYPRISLEEQKEIAQNILDNLEKKWGEINNKDEIINVFNSDPSTLNYKEFDEIKASINHPNAKHIEKILIAMNLDYSDESRYILLITAQSK